MLSAPKFPGRRWTPTVHLTSWTAAASFANNVGAPCHHRLAHGAVLGVIDRVPTALMLILAPILLLGCAPSSGAAHASPGQVLRETAAAMSGVRSADLKLSFGPGIDLGGLSLISATAEIARPNDSSTTFKVQQGDFLVDLVVVTLAGHTYIRLPFSNFTQLTPAQAAELPPLSSLLEPGGGLDSILSHGGAQRWLGPSQIGGVECDGVSVTLSPAQLASIMGPQAAPAAAIQVQIWSATQDHLIRRLKLKGPLLTPGRSVQVEIDVADYNRPLVIVTPSPLA